MARAIHCGDPKTLSGGGILPLLARLPTKKGPMTYRGSLLGEAEHTQPAGAVHTSVSNELRSHIFYGEVDLKKGNSTGWHHRPSADPKKGTYVIEGTESPKDKHGVYEANVKIEGIKKGPRSSFFPDDWSQAKVEQAIDEAYANRQFNPKNGYYQGYSSEGVKIEMRVGAKGKITTAYPLPGEGR